MPEKEDSVEDGPNDKGPLELEYVPPKDRPLLMINNISKNYRDKLVLKDVNFEIFPGDIFGVIGMSGSGKTTLFQLMSGLLKPQAGDILVRSGILLGRKKNRKNTPDYVSVFKNMKYVKRMFGFASQLPSFYEHLTVEENLRLYGSLYGMNKRKIRENIGRLLKFVNLSTERNALASELSGGMQRRLDIACALIHEPKVLFLDEPTSDLDPVMRKQIWQLIKDIAEKGTTVILSSHILFEVEHLCSKVAILHGRRILGYGTLSELKELFKRNMQVRVHFESAKYNKLIKNLRKIKDIERVIEKDDKLVIFLPADDKVARKIMKVIGDMPDRLISLEVSDATLAEIFETLTRKF